MQWRKFSVAAVLMAAAVGLSGCFDLDQSVAINRDGSGQYRLSLAARGMMGEAMKNGKSDIHFGQNANTRTRTVIEGDKVTKVSTVDFKQLSDLALSNETIAVAVRGHELFGLGTTHAVFRRVFSVDDAKRQNMHDDDSGAGKAVIASLFGDHTYVFAVRLPGSIDWIAPVWVGDAQVKPEVSGDDVSGHTITWRMPLTDLIETRALHFSVGFSAYGALKDSQSRRVSDSDTKI
jgi:hypothetical protein